MAINVKKIQRYSMVVEDLEILAFGAVGEKSDTLTLTTNRGVLILSENLPGTDAADLAAALNTAIAPHISTCTDKYLTVINNTAKK